MLYYLTTKLCQPYPVLLFLIGLAATHLWRRAKDCRRAAICLALTLGILVVVSLPATSFLLMQTLEAPYPPTELAPAEDDLIIVLTGGLAPPNELWQHAELNDSSIYRCMYAANLSAHANSCRILITGGKADPAAPGQPCSQVMRDLIVRLGADAANLLIDDQSRNTFESAVACRSLLSEHPAKRVFLVTDAAHLRRAVASFHREGIDVVPAGCHYRAAVFDWRFTMFVPSPTALGAVHSVCHEWLGLCWYWLRGRL